MPKTNNKKVCDRQRSKSISFKRANCNTLKKSGDVNKDFNKIFTRMSSDELLSKMKDKIHF